MRILKKKYDGWALITGASSGIGKEMARELAKQKFNLVLVARNEEALEQLAQEVVSHHGIRTKVVALDLIQDTAPQTLYETGPVSGKRICRFETHDTAQC